jgi:2-dehydropantoate 2-reductase
MRAMRIGIVGSGGVGGYFGGRLAAAGVDVTFIARGAHLAAMREHGLRIESPGGNLHVPRVSATDDPASVGPVDIVFFTVKLYDSEAACATLGMRLVATKAVDTLPPDIRGFFYANREFLSHHVNDPL